MKIWLVLIGVVAVLGLGWAFRLVAWPYLAGKNTVSERLGQYGQSARARLKPHFAKAGAPDAMSRFRSGSPPGPARSLRNPDAQLGFMQHVDRTWPQHSPSPRPLPRGEGETLAARRGIGAATFLPRQKS